MKTLISLFFREQPDLGSNCPNIKDKYGNMTLKLYNTSEELNRI